MIKADLQLRRLSLRSTLLDLLCLLEFRVVTLGASNTISRSSGFLVFSFFPEDDLLPDEAAENFIKDWSAKGINTTYSLLYNY